MAAEQLRELFTVIEGGAEVAIENVETFAPDVVIPGAAELLGKTETVALGNGAAAEVSQLVTQTTTTTATTAGVGLLALEMPTAIAAAVPFLGCFAGMTLYNLAPEFWTSVADNLMQAGETIGGKLRAFVNSATGAVGFSEKSLNIIKNALIQAGIYNSTTNFPDPPTAATYIASLINGKDLFNYFVKRAPLVVGIPQLHYEQYSIQINDYFATYSNCIIRITTHLNPTYEIYLDITAVPNYTVGSSLPYPNIYAPPYFQHCTMYFEMTGYPKSINFSSGNNWSPISRFFGESIDDYNFYMGNVNGTITPSENVQPGAVTPTENDPISTTYPNLTPWQLPEELPTIYPIEVPVNNPNPSQQQAQNPAADPEPAPYLDWLLQVLPQPEPNPNPEPEPTPEPDPDPQPEPEPLPVIDPVEIDPDPVDPNKPVQPSPLPIIPDLPSTVDSNAMFTVYAPSISQLNAFGGWLWSNNIIDMLLRIWQNPLEGIIAFQKVYAVPTVGTSSNIIVGYIDSEVPAPIVTSQFVTVNCGTITVDEILNNATDYPPYTMLHIYLPFIGIVELDCNEFMNGSITVTYHIDVYTGTCLVEVASTRSPDMTSPTIIYTFSGNASQQLPLTSSNFGGALNALVSTVSGVARMGSGGALNAISGLSSIGHSVSHEMIHIAHSGDLSANAGIMALRTPYLIIGRRNSYDANAYNELYGYPANKTVYLGNCSGFTRVKAGFLRSEATEEEKQEIMDLLKKGVIL